MVLLLLLNNHHHSHIHSLSHSFTHSFTHSLTPSTRHQSWIFVTSPMPRDTSTSTVLVQPPINGRRAPHLDCLSDLFVSNCDHKLTPANQEGPSTYIHTYIHTMTTTVPATLITDSMTTSSETRGPGSIPYGSRRRTAGCTAQRCDDTGDP